MPRSYTYTVNCSFELQHTFVEDEVEQDAEGREGDMAPTEQALAELAAQVRASLSQQFSIANIETWADSDGLLGVEESD